MMPPTIATIDLSATNANPIIVYSQRRDASAINNLSVANVFSSVAVPSGKGTIGMGSTGNSRESLFLS